MNIEIGYYPQVLLLVLSRVAAVVWMVPFFGGTTLSPRIKISTALVIALAILPVVPGEWAAAAGQIYTLAQMLVAVLREILLGAVIGLICHCFVAACMFSGTQAAHSASLSMANTIDPLHGAQSNTLALLLQTVFILIVVTSNGHLALIRFLAMSFQESPRSLLAVDNFAAMTLALGSTIFDWGVRLALPAICAGLVVNVGMALAARMAPSFNVLFLSLPIRLFVGLSVLGMTLKHGADAFERLMMEMLEACKWALA